MTQTGKKVAQAAGLLMAANLICRILGQLRDTAIAAWFGQNAFTDAYRAAFSIPDLLFFLLAGGVFSSAFVPVFTQYLADGRDDEAWEVFSILATLLTVAIGVLVVLG
ncbi:MAG: murein biosynthesis integral membrane protein MurJ, partial [Candidatus Sumerlaeota bacterium]|nr:murein biosynthesis integral membrane protein MurJ [Candidatus Sumerlaeota bacterium]